MQNSYMANFGSNIFIMSCRRPGRPLYDKYIYKHMAAVVGTPNVVCIYIYIIHDAASATTIYIRTPPSLQMMLPYEHKYTPRGANTLCATMPAHCDKYIPDRTLGVLFSLELTNQNNVCLL